MTASERQELFRVLAAIGELVPEVRFGQLIANLSYMARGPSNGSIWDMEDDELLRVARKHLEEWRSRRSAPVPASVELESPSLSQVPNP
jgi:hypothetical protein